MSGSPPAPRPAAQPRSSAGYPPVPPPPTGISYVHPARTPARPQRAQWDFARLLLLAGPISLILYLLCGFLFGGWAWAWLFFLVPGALLAMNRGRH